MAATVAMPRLSDTMEEGTVLKWLIEEGGEVKRGEPLVEIETDKANMTYEADTDGVLVSVIAKEGDTLAVGEPIAEIGEAGEEPSAAGEQEAGEESGGEQEAGEEAGGEEADRQEPGAEADQPAGDAGEQGASDDGGGGREPESQSPRAATAEAGTEGPRGPEGGTEGPSGAESPGGGDGGERIKASPVAKRMARELGVELARLEGSGPGGRIVKADVESASQDGGGAEAEPAEAPAPQAEPAEAEAAEAEPAEAEAAEAEVPEPEPAEASTEAPPAERSTVGVKGEVEVQELTRMQQTVTRRMAESKATAPDFALTLDVDMTAAVELRERLKEVADPVPSYNDMIVKAAAGALREFPKVNGAYRDGRFELYEKANVGIAVAAEGTLVVPTIFGAESRSLGDIARTARALIEKVREGNVTPPELSGGTFTVSNLGMYGIERFTAIINPPQAALLAVGSLEKKPAVDDRGRVVARDQITLTLICDHRILYGADGAGFLARLRELLEQPLALAL